MKFGNVWYPKTARYAFLASYSVHRLPLADDPRELRRRHLAELRRPGVDLRIADLAEVLVVRRQDRAAG